MRKLTLVLALCAGFSAMAQVLNVESVTQVKAPFAGAKVAAVSPQGDYLLVTNDINQGLTKLDLATGATERVTDAAGAGYDVKVSQDGGTVVFRENSFTKNHLRKVALTGKNLATGEQTQLVKATRDLQGVAVQGATAMTVTKGKTSAKALGKAKAVKGTLAYTTRDYQLMVSQDGKSRQLAPLGADKRYLWVSLSPDGTRVLFFVSADAAYVCDLNGSNVKRLGVLRAAKWLDNNTVVGMNDTDDGHVTTASAIVAMTLDGVSQTLTADDVIAMYPQVGGNKIAFSTPQGDTYVINFTK